MIHHLAVGADVVLENYGPGTMERLGCGYEQLARLNPRLVYLALKGYLAGPYEHRPALDKVIARPSTRSSFHSFFTLSKKTPASFRLKTAIDDFTRTELQHCAHRRI